jgi:hypothetical protein
VTIGASLLAGMLPPVLWMARNRAVMGDFTGSQAKVAYLGWTIKPWAEIWQHPIFTLHGAGYFLREVLLKYWRGELVWQGIPMRSAVMDGYYLVSTVLLTAVFAASVVQRVDLGACFRAKTARPYCFGLFFIWCLFRFCFWRQSPSV